MTREEAKRYIDGSLPVPRKITDIIIHCSATIEGKNYSARDIDVWHKSRGFRKIGYHFVVQLDGNIEQGRPLAEVGAHVSGHNSNSIGICYIGGLSRERESKDTRTPEQKESLLFLVKALKAAIPTVTKVAGHRDYSPDLNGDGVIEPHEWIKTCPCFDATKEYSGC